MSHYKTDTRAAYSRQPAQYVLFDIGHPITSTLIHSTIMSVQNVLILACSIRGGNRIPAFGLAMINQTFQTVCNLQAIRGNFSKIVAALTSLLHKAKICEVIPLEDFKDNLYMAIQSLLEEFKSKSELMSSNSKWRFPSQLQITLVTSKNGLEIQQYLEETVQNMNIAKLRKIQVLQLPNTMENLICENNTIDLEQKGSTHFVRGSEFVELIKIREIKKDLENIFKTWLLDCDIDREHLRIIFPHSTDVHDFTYSLIKCDIAECLINPLSLPFGHRYQIQTDFCSIQLGGSGITKSIGNDVSIYELEVVACLSSSSICQSQLFGQPGRLYPTQCWHLDWEEHLINRQIYISLCKKLLERDQYLLTRLKEHFHNMNELAGYFILQSDGSELLLNAVVSAELVLPTRENVRSCTSNEKMAHEILNEMGDSLDRLPLIQEFEPSDFSSGLYSMLSRNLKHTSRDSTEFPNESSTYNTVISDHPALDPASSSGNQTRGNKRKRGASSINV